MISSMIRSGSSERGLSEVTITCVGQARRDRAHQRPLAAVAVAAGAEHADHPPGGLGWPLQQFAGRRSTFSSESGVWA